MSPFEGWDSFYVIVGGAAGALIGLQFVVIALIAERPPPRIAEASPVFSTPTIVHFCAVLALAALMRVPWEAEPCGLGCMALGLAGVLYMLVVGWRMRRQQAYAPDIEDWTFHFVVPLAAYGLLAGSGYALPSRPGEALFGIAGAAVILLFDGIHNAWDAAAYTVTRNLK
jgi:hypothetical protein